MNPHISSLIFFMTQTVLTTSPSNNDQSISPFHSKESLPAPYSYVWTSISTRHNMGLDPEVRSQSKQKSPYLINSVMSTILLVIQSKNYAPVDT